jgi:hypothetical protein
MPSKQPTRGTQDAAASASVGPLAGSHGAALYARCPSMRGAGQPALFSELAPTTVGLCEPGLPLPVQYPQPPTRTTCLWAPPSYMPKCKPMQAYSAMMVDEQRQAILISGESGAGKTESAKMVMQVGTAQRGGAGQGRGSIKVDQCWAAECKQGQLMAKPDQGL